jgi:hypothetical protein
MSNGKQQLCSQQHAKGHKITKGRGRRGEEREGVGGVGRGEEPAQLQVARDATAITLAPFARVPDS